MPRVIEIDTRQREGAHKLKHDYFQAEGYTTLRTKLPFGDYRFVGGVWTVDTKQSISELASDLHQQHDRFHRECEGAQTAGYQLVILVENAYGMTCLDDLATWTEPYGDMKKRKGRKQLNGQTMAKMCRTMSERYGVYWGFCAPYEAGRRVIEILEGGESLGRKPDT